MTCTIAPRADAQACERCRIRHTNGHTLTDWDEETLVYLCDPCLIPYYDTYLWSGGNIEHRIHSQSDGIREY